MRDFFAGVKRKEFFWNKQPYPYYLSTSCNTLGNKKSPYPQIPGCKNLSNPKHLKYY